MRKPFVLYPGFELLDMGTPCAEITAGKLALLWAVPLDMCEVMEKEEAQSVIPYIEAGQLHLPVDSSRRYQLCTAHAIFRKGYLSGHYKNVPDNNQRKPE